MKLVSGVDNDWPQKIVGNLLLNEFLLKKIISP